jgi:fumarylacetoacetase
MTDLDETHDPSRRSWVPGADGHADFPVQNLPLGVFSPTSGGRRAGVAVGDHILDLQSLAESGLLSGGALAAARAAGPTLNAMLKLGEGPRRALRKELSRLLSLKRYESTVRPMLHEAKSCSLHLPCAIGDYTDFYAGIHHATNVGRQFRPDNPLLPNYKHIPIGYHGRASSVLPSSEPIRRPNGQSKPPDAAAPSVGSSRRLDYELELGIWIGPGNALGEPAAIHSAAAHIAGYCLLNDWSARDIQAWEHQPLGPFLAKNFATTVSCWIVTPEALAPYRIPQPPRPEGDPALPPYLLDKADQAGGALDLHLEVILRTAAMQASRAEGRVVARTNARCLYWTPAQMVAHHTIGGCNLRPGDLLGTGTISGSGRDECGSMLEATMSGNAPIPLGDGEERRFLEDGDEVVLRARAVRDGFVTLGFGECRGVILPAPDLM